MVKRKVPIRKCIGCNESKPKKELIRIVKDQQGNIKVDTTGKAAGRGAYICCNILCLESAQKGKRLHKAFEMNITEDLFEELSRQIKKEYDS